MTDILKQMLVGDRILLVPYEKYHVPRYNAWLQNEELQELIGTSVSTLVEDFEMQQRWFDEKDKCMFIVVEKSLYRGGEGEPHAMCGDVNLFYTDASIAEVNVMIAKTECRGRGLGKETVMLAMQYGLTHLNLTKFIAKIISSNTASLNMFYSLGYKKVGESEIFNETTLEWERAPGQADLAALILEPYTDASGHF